MKLTAAAILLTASQASGFQPLSAKFATTSLPSHDHNLVEPTSDGRRQFMKNSLALVMGIGSVQGVLVENASASLLEEFGTDPTKLPTETETRAKEAVKVAPKAESNYEPNLRSNYYYPTNKKRYLPRIKKCNDAIPEAAAMIGSNDWEGVEIFASQIAEDTILPMKLYTSSLLGGGTNVKVAFAKDMNNAAADFEKAQKALVKAIAKKDQQKSSKALEELSSALLAYRTAGKLLGPDGGGDIPSVDEIRRAACRVQGRTFEQKVKARDERLKEAGAL